MHAMHRRHLELSALAGLALLLGLTTAADAPA
jgi:hypothetical protein